MAYTSKHVTDAAIRVVGNAANASMELVSLSMLFAAKGGTPAAFAGAVAHIVNPQTNKPYSVKLPFNIGNKLRQHMPDGIAAMGINEARAAALDYAKRHRDHFAAMGATSWAQWDKVAVETIDSNAAADTLAQYDAGKAAKAEARKAAAAETAALVEAGKAAIATPTPPAAPDADAPVKVDPAAMLAAALELIAAADKDTLIDLGSAISARLSSIATVEAERSAAAAKVKGRRKAA